MSLSDLHPMTATTALIRCQIGRYAASLPGDAFAHACCRSRRNSGAEQHECIVVCQMRLQPSMPAHAVCTGRSRWADVSISIPTLTLVCHDRPFGSACSCCGTVAQPQHVGRPAIPFLAVTGLSEGLSERGLEHWAESSRPGPNLSRVFRPSLAVTHTSTCLPRLTGYSASTSAVHCRRTPPRRASPRLSSQNCVKMIPACRGLVPSPSTIVNAVESLYLA